MSSKLTKVVANFETSLATKLANGAVAGALTSITDRNGQQLPNGRYCMIVDRGTGDEEHLAFDLTDSAMSNIVSVSRQGSQTPGVQNQNGHRAGAKCYLTDFVNLKIIVDILNGDDTLDASKPIKYGADPNFNDSKQLISKGYADGQLATKASADGNNAFTGNNTFTISPNIPDATQASQPVTLAQLMAAALTGVQDGIEYFDVSFLPNGEVASIHDNMNGKTYVFRYDAFGELLGVYDGTRQWSVLMREERISRLTH